MSLSDSPLVSVVIAFFNEERFLAEAIESVLNQEYQDWQLLLADDGSTDQSTAIAKRYAEQFPDKIIYCEHEGHVNKGVCASRNYGIEQGRGQFIALLDADDVWRPEKLSNQVRIFQKHRDVSMIVEASLYWYSWKDSMEKDVLIPVGAPANRVYQPTELSALLYPLGSGAAPCPSGLMLKKQAWQAVGGFEESFTKQYQLYEDQAFLSKVYLKEKVYVSDTCNNLYRQRLGSCVQSVKEQGQYLHVRRHFLEWLVRYIRVEKPAHVGLNTLLAKALFPYRHPFRYKLANFSSAQVIKKLLARVKS